MHAFLPLVGALCILEANVFVSARTRSFSEKALLRVTREPNAPRPIDCLLSPWSDWGPCNPCSKEKYRSRRVVQFGQFDGKPCIEPLGDNQRCVPSGACPADEEINCHNDFKCDNGRCIKSRLMCNTEDDCGDYSDENDCDDIVPRPPCGDRIIDVSEIGRTAGRGVNILGMVPKETPFYNEFYNGACDRVRDGNTGIYHRKPWNVAVLTYDTKGDKRFTFEQYENQITVVKELFKETTQYFKASLSLKLKPTEDSNASVDIGMNFNSAKSASINNFFKESNNKDQTFLSVKGNIELGTFQMRRRDVRLTDTFLEDLMYLPSEYDKGEYFKFLEMHGTHFAQRGTVGGKYELVYVLDNQAMKKEGVTVQNVKDCMNYDAGFSIRMEGTEHEAAINVQGGECSGGRNKDVLNLNSSAIIHDVISLVHGGKTVALIKLKETLLRTPKMVPVDLYAEWAATVPDAPTVIRYESSPISTLVPLTMHDSYTKKQNLEQAVEDYIAEYSVCKCQPCQNGGTVMLVNGECICGCSPNFKGLACQIPKSSTAPAQGVTDGRWSCWSDWSVCAQGERTRTRQCNNPEPGFGGEPCAGPVSEQSYCAE